MNNVKIIRKSRGLSQVELARQARIASTNLSAIECGRVIAWPRVRRALSEALNLPEIALFPELTINTDRRQFEGLKGITDGR